MRIRCAEGVVGLDCSSSIRSQNIAATALFLANKTEENCRKTKDLIIAVAKVAQKNSKLIIDEQSKEYWRWRDSILTYEEVMLETLTFDLMIDTPYHRLFEHLKELELAHNKRLRESAWAFCNDSCLTILPLLMEARDVAVSAIFFASIVTETKIEDVNGEAWWLAFGGSEGLMTKGVSILTDFYSENPLRKQGPAYPGPGSPVFNLESTRRRGEPMLLSQNGTPMGTDAGTQSPITTNSKILGGEPDQDDETTAGGNDSEARVTRGAGDSDVALKAAANDLDVHKGKPNGRYIRSPDHGKRKTLEDEDLQAESEGERRSKRARTDDGEAPKDEGEVVDDG